MLFELNVTHEIVDSSAEKILQHSGMTWKVEGDHFIRKRYLSEESIVYNKAIDDWIGNATMEQRQAFTRDIFDAMKAAGAVSIYDISKGGFHDFEQYFYLQLIQRVRPRLYLASFLALFGGQ